eukprot:9388763-Pyramimonas_sp.AAC.1
MGDRVGIFSFERLLWVIGRSHWPRTARLARITQRLRVQLAFGVDDVMELGNSQRHVGVYYNGVITDFLAR